MGKEMSGEEFESVLEFFDRVFRNPAKYPDKAVILPLHDAEITRVFTPKRLELIELIKKEQPTTAAKLAKVTGRKVEGVLRDMALLKELHIVQHERIGKEVVLTLKQDFLVIPMVGSMTIKELKQKAKQAVPVAAKQAA